MNGSPVPRLTSSHRYFDHDRRLFPAGTKTTMAVPALIHSLKELAMRAYSPLTATSLCQPSRETSTATFFAVTCFAVFYFSVFWPATSFGQITLQTTEGKGIEIRLANLISSSTEPAESQVVRDPESGTISAVAQGRFLYEPQARFVGFDSAIFQVATGPGSASLVEAKIRVLPKALPTAGTFTAGGYGAFGLYHQQKRYFQLCDAWESIEMVMKCRSLPVIEASKGWLPVYGDWDGDGWQSPSLFDPTTATLHQLAEDAEGTHLRIQQSVRFPGKEWTWPVAGDWQNTGIHSLLLIDDNGVISQIDPFAISDRGTTWQNSIPVPSNNDFPWPTARPNADQGPDALAVVHFSHGNVYWTTGGATNLTQGSQDIGYQSGRLIPIHGAPAVLYGLADLYLLETRWINGQRVYLIDHWTHGHPSTLPLKFPHEPPGI